MLLLPAISRERLDEVAAAVEQPDADDRDAEIAGCLQVVTGEDSEPAAVLRQRLGDAELGREVGDGPGGAPSDWYQPGVFRYASSSAAAPEAARKPWSAASPPNAPSGTAPSRSHRILAAGRQASGSTESNRSSVSGCQDQRRFSTSSEGAASGSGKRARTVNRRRALTEVSLVGGLHSAAAPAAPDRQDQRCHDLVLNRMIRPKPCSWQR